jgi:hypothetical protein
VAAARDTFAARGCSVLVVSQAKPELLAHYVARTQLPVPVVCDPARAAYAAFGLERTNWFTFFKPRVLWGYFRGMFKGYRVRAPNRGEDVLQLGGDFVLSRERKLLFAYRSADPTDRPTVTDLLAALPSAAPIGGERAPDGPPARPPIG